MNQNLIFYPLLVQLLLTLAMYIWLGVAKSKAAKAGQVDEARRALHADAWPVHVQQINNNIANQFEAPVLFYALVGMLWATHQVNPLTLLIAWAFVISRIAHAYVHTGSNYVPRRRAIFMLGTLLLLILTVIAAAGLISLSPPQS